MAVEDGVSGFIVMADNPRSLRHYAEEVVPVVREQVSAVRGERGTQTLSRIRDS
jgi:hypothetical protein